MAFRISQLFTATVKLSNNHRFVYNASTVNLLKFPITQIEHTRNITFFNKKDVSELWKSATSVSNSGKKRGRGKNVQRRTNIYKVIGHQVNTIQFPGFTSPIKKGNSFLNQRELISTGKVERKVANEHLSTSKFAKQDKADVDTSVLIKSVALRGWTSASIKGKKLGPPDPTVDDTFEGFESWIVNTKLRTSMHSTMGRVKVHTAMCITGNGNGTAGFAEVAGQTSASLTARGKNAAAKRLITIGRYEDRTVFHDFHAQYGKARIIVKQVPAGHGLVCHRVLKVCCEAFGIKDLYAKCEGSDNIRYIVRAFFVGLLKQKSHEQLANEKKLHVVELRGENYFFPKVLASPNTVRKEEEIPSTEVIDYNQYLLNGKVLHLKKRPAPFYTKLKSWETYLGKAERRRGQDEIRLKLKSQYNGTLKSFLAETYPEAMETRWRKQKGDSEE